MSEESKQVFEKVLSTHVSTNSAVRQLQASSVRKVPKELILAKAPELLFKAEEAVKFQCIRNEYSQCQSGFKEYHVLGSLDLEVQKAVMKESPQIRRVGDISMEEIKQMAAEKMQRDREAIMIAERETAVRSLVSLQGFVLPETSFGGDARRQQEAFRALMHAASVHTEIHRTSSAGRLKLKMAPIGGPREGTEDDQLEGSPNSRSGQVCPFGVAPVVGIVVNHPFVHRATSRSIESLCVVSVWGRGGNLYERLRTGRRISNGVVVRWVAGVAACLTVLHQRELCLGRLDSHVVSLFPREPVKERAPGDTRVLTPDAKVSDLTHVLKDGSTCPWSLRELVSDGTYLPPHMTSHDGPGEASQHNDLWYLGCLALELILKAPLATCNFGRVSDLTPRQLDGLFPERFSDELKRVVTSLLLHDETLRPSAAQVLEDLMPKEAARLRGEDLRGWYKRHPRPTASPNFFDDDDCGDEDTDSGSEEDSVSEEENTVDDSDDELDKNGMSKGKYRYGVKEAVDRASKRVVAYNRATWWASLSEEKRVNVLHRRRVRRQSKSRIAFLKFCQILAMFKEWGNRDAAVWYRRAVTMSVLAGHLEPFTQPHKDAVFDFDEDDEDEEEEEDEENDSEVEREATPIEGNAKGSPVVSVDRVEGTIGAAEDLTSMLKHLQSVGSYYDLTERAAKCGLTPSLRPCRTGAAGDLGGNEASDLEEYKIALRRSKQEQQAALAGVPLPVELPPPTIPEPREPPPMVPPPHRYELNPYPSGAEAASIEWKANGYVYWAGLSEAFQEADSDFKALMKTPFAYEEPSVQSERLLHLRVFRIREQQSLKPIIERTISSAEPSTPSDEQVDRAACMISLCLVQAFINTTTWMEVGRHWASSRGVALIRGWLTRKIISRVWEDAATLAREKIVAEEDSAIAVQGKWRDNMASREGFVRGGTSLNVVFAPKVLGRMSRSFDLGLPEVLAPLIKQLWKTNKRFNLDASPPDKNNELLRGTECIAIIIVSISVVSVAKDASRKKATAPPLETCHVEGLMPASSYLLQFHVVGKDTASLLVGEDPSWVSGDLICLKERTQGDVPDRPLAPSLNMALLEDNVSLPCVLTGRLKPNSESSRSTSHLTWTSPLGTHGSSVDKYRILRRFVLLFRSPIASDDSKGIRKVACGWRGVFEDLLCEWTDLMENTEEQVEALNLASSDQGNYADGCDEHIEMFDEGSAKSGLPPGVLLTVEYRVAAHNQFGWGRASSPSSRVIKALTGVLVTLPEEWVDAYEQGTRQNANVVALPLLRPQHLTDGIFHNFVEMNQTSQVPSSNENYATKPNPPKLPSQATEYGLRTTQWKRATPQRSPIPKVSKVGVNPTEELVLGRVEDEDMTAERQKRGIKLHSQSLKIATAGAKNRKENTHNSSQVFIRPNCKTKKKEAF